MKKCGLVRMYIMNGNNKNWEDTNNVGALCLTVDTSGKNQSLFQLMDPEVNFIYSLLLLFGCHTKNCDRLMLKTCKFIRNPSSIKQKFTLITFPFKE